MAAPRRCFLVDVNTRFLGETKYRLIGTAVSADSREIVLDDGTGLLHVHIQPHMREMAQGKDVQVLVERLSNKLIASCIMRVEDPNEFILQTLQICYQESGRKSRNGFPVLENAAQLFEYIASRKTGVSLPELVQDFAVDEQQFQEWLTALQMDGLIYYRDGQRYMVL